MIKNANDLFELNRNSLPDPNNPKPGDTYENVVDYGMFKLIQRIVVVDYDSNYKSTRIYLNGEIKHITNFTYFVRSMKNIKVVLDA